MVKNKFVIHGAIVSIALSAVYFAIVSIAQGFPHALEEFASIWYLMVPLIAGFGAQVGLFSYTHAAIRSVSSKGVATSGVPPGRRPDVDCARKLCVGKP